jgi:hypothetical protein
MAKPQRHSANVEQLYEREKEQLDKPKSSTLPSKLSKEELAAGLSSSGLTVEGEGTLKKKWFLKYQATRTYLLELEQKRKILLGEDEKAKLVNGHINENGTENDFATIFSYLKIKKKKNGESLSISNIDQLILRSYDSEISARNRVLRELLETEKGRKMTLQRKSNIHHTRLCP